MSAIVIEDKLEAIFGLIPSWTFTKPDNTVVTVNKPTYDYGGFEEYNALLKEKKDSIYPLIFQRLTTENQDYKAKDGSIEIELILAKNNKRTELRNPTRWKTSYKNILMPLVDYVVQTLSKSRIISWDNTYTLDKYPNYSVNNDTKDTNQVIDIIDVVVFKATIKITGNVCVDKQIIYKT